MMMPAIHQRKLPSKQQQQQQQQSLFLRQGSSTALSSRSQRLHVNHHQRKSDLSLCRRRCSSDGITKLIVTIAMVVMLVIVNSKDDTLLSVVVDGFVYHHHSHTSIHKNDKRVIQKQLQLPQQLHPAIHTSNLASRRVATQNIALYSIKSKNKHTQNGGSRNKNRRRKKNDKKKTKNYRRRDNTQSSRNNIKNDTISICDDNDDNKSIGNNNEPKKKTKRIIYLEKNAKNVNRHPSLFAKDIDNKYHQHRHHGGITFSQQMLETLAVTIVSAKRTNSIMRRPPTMIGNTKSSSSSSPKSNGTSSSSPTTSFLFPNRNTPKTRDNTTRLQVNNTTAVPGSSSTSTSNSEDQKLHHPLQSPQSQVHPHRQQARTFDTKLISQMMKARKGAMSETIAYISTLSSTNTSSSIIDTASENKVSTAAFATTPATTLMFDERNTTTNNEFSSGKEDEDPSNTAIVDSDPITIINTTASTTTESRSKLSVVIDGTAENVTEPLTLVTACKDSQKISAKTNINSNAKFIDSTEPSSKTSTYQNIENDTNAIFSNDRARMNTTSTTIITALKDTTETDNTTSISSRNNRTIEADDNDPDAEATVLDAAEAVVTANYYDTMIKNMKQTNTNNISLKDIAYTINVATNPVMKDIEYTITPADEAVTTSTANNESSIVNTTHFDEEGRKGANGVRLDKPSDDTTDDVGDAVSSEVVTNGTQTLAETAAVAEFETGDKLEKATAFNASVAEFETGDKLEKAPAFNASVPATALSSTMTAPTTQTDTDYETKEDIPNPYSSVFSSLTDDKGFSKPESLTNITEEAKVDPTYGQSLSSLPSSYTSDSDNNGQSTSPLTPPHPAYLPSTPLPASSMSKSPIFIIEEPQDLLDFLTPPQQQDADGVTDTICVVKVWARWCQSCKAIEPKYKQLATKLRREESNNPNSSVNIKFSELEYAKGTVKEELADGLQATKLPHILIYKNMIKQTSFVCLPKDFKSLLVQHPLLVEAASSASPTSLALPQSANNTPNSYVPRPY